MKLTEEEKNKLENIYQSFRNDEKILRMKEIRMHRGSNCYLHSFRVARLVVKRGLRYKQIDLESLLVAAILHDYYLYDWRVDKSKRKGHGKNHPIIAVENAKADFDVPEKVQKMILSHMWPFNIKEFPNSTEARILKLADSHVATMEASTSIAFKKQREKEYYKEIEKLFN